MRLLLTALAALTLTACAGSPSLPERRIDRPYTLPVDTRELTVGFSYRTEQSHAAARDTDWNIPTGLSVPINENWTWDVLTSVRYQIHHDTNDTLGVRFGAASLGYTSFRGYFLEPLASLYYRRNLGRSLAVESALGGSYLWTEHLKYDPFRIFLRVAPVVQLDDSKAFAPRILVERERNYGLFINDDDFVSPGYGTEFVFPVGADFSWRFSPQWEGVLDYAYHGLGYKNGYRAQVGSLLVRHFW